ncbi:MAG: carboxypeptidase regulatory-like domain-containing protein [Myxococcota bacterium]|nr:carboxypeptidase regulatory-like domain-containing protein [Myxococcota bacterium]
MYKFRALETSMAFALCLVVTVGPSAALAQGTPDIPPPPAPTAPAAEEKVPAKETESGSSETPAAPESSATLAPPPAESVIPSSPGSTSASVEAPTTSQVELPAASAPKKSARTASSQSGAAGLIGILSADGGTVGTFRLGFGLDMFGGSNVFTSSDELTKVGATLSVASSPIEHLELWFNTKAQSTTSNLTNPNLLQAQGDFSLGAKGYVEVAPMVDLAAAAQVSLLSGIGGSNFDSAVFRLSGIASFDLSKTEAKAPVKIHVNAGAIFDGSDNLTDSELSQPERFALGINAYNRAALGFAIEAPVKYITPFLEYSLEIPWDYFATPGIVLTSVDNHSVSANALRAAQDATEVVESTGFARAAIPRTMPQTLTPGLRVTAVPNLALDLGVAIGLTPEQAPGVPSVLPYTVFMQASYAIDPFATAAAPPGPPVTIPVIIPEVKVVEAPKKLGYFMGQVTNVEGGKPLKDVIVTTDRSSPVASAKDGRFMSHEIEPGPVKVSVQKEGFKPQTIDLTVVAGQTVEAAVKLEPAIERGRLSGKVVDADGQPLSGVQIQVFGKQNTKLTTDRDGLYQTLLEVGDYRLIVSDIELYKTGASVSVKKGPSTLNFTLLRTESSPVVKVRKQKLSMKKKIEFEEGSADLSTEAKAHLDYVVDALHNNVAKKIRVESHVDNANDEADNVRVTRARAENIANYLVSKGVADDRVSWEGVGSKRPRVPNLTARGRKRNRRIEFHIVE